MSSVGRNNEVTEFFHTDILNIFSAESRAASRVGSRAASPAHSVRSRVSRRAKPRTPSPPSIPSSDADLESGSESNDDHEKDVPSLGPAPPPPSASWECEHCTFVNEAGVRVCAVCCRTPTAVPQLVTSAIKLTLEDRNTPARQTKKKQRKIT